MFRRLALLAPALAVPLALTALGCGSDSTGAPVVAVVNVSPDADTVEAGATTQFSVSVLDDLGSPVSGVTVSWNSTNTSVATVNSSGTATGVVMGTTTIRATAGGVTGDAQLVVTANGNPDPPDDNFVDSNGDGIDGDIAKAVFVVAGGSDSNPGTIAAPKATIGAAIAEAAGDPSKTEVYVSLGTYSETVELAAGVSVYGGYNGAVN